MHLELFARVLIGRVCMCVRASVFSNKYVKSGVSHVYVMAESEASYVLRLS